MAPAAKEPVAQAILLVAREAVSLVANRDHHTLPVALANLLGEHSLDVELMMAGAVITVLPVLIVFLVLQRYYIAGLMAGSVKG